MAFSGKEPVFGLDDFNKPKYFNESETIAYSILNLLFGRPGYFPSMPNLGINIQESLYSFFNEIDINQLKAKIISQCKVIKEFVDDGSFDIQKTFYKHQPMLIIVLPLIIKNVKEHLGIAITQDSEGNTSYNYVFREEEL